MTCATLWRLGGLAEATGRLLRDSASKWLDIGPDEIEVGVHPSRRHGQVLGQVFLADSLENGAGYASRLGIRFEALLDVADEYASGLKTHGGRPCDSSCYGCLRDYGNRSWHPLLDWRLGVDLLDMFRGRNLDVGRQRDRDLKAARAFASDFGFEVIEDEVPVVVGRSGAKLAILHPFEDLAVGSVNARFQMVMADHPRAVVASSFDLLRRPGALLGQLMS